MFKTLWIHLFLGLVMVADESIEYTFKGVKDSRLKAQFIVKYIASSNAEGCTNLRLTTGTKRLEVADKVYEIEDGNYSISIPIAFSSDSDECGYQFRRIALKVQRKYDDKLYSSHVLLDTDTKSHPIYYGRWGGSGGQLSLEMPASLETDKKYYRIAKETYFLCATKWNESDKHISFFCRMQLGDGQGNCQFIPLNEAKTVVTHPYFGINEIKDETLQVNIQVEEERCTKLTFEHKKEHDYFREVSKPWWAWMRKNW